MTIKESPFVDVTPMPKDGVCREIENAEKSYRCTNGTKGTHGFLSKELKMTCLVFLLLITLKQTVVMV